MVCTSRVLTHASFWASTTGSLIARICTSQSFVPPVLLHSGLLFVAFCTHLPPTSAHQTRDFIPVPLLLDVTHTVTGVSINPTRNGTQHLVTRVVQNPGRHVIGPHLFDVNVNASVPAVCPERPATAVRSRGTANKTVRTVCTGHNYARTRAGPRTGL